MEIIDGIITGMRPNGDMTIYAKYTNLGKFIKQNVKDCRVVLRDSRMLTNEQRKKIYALLNEISDYMGEMPEYTKRLFKLKFIHEQMQDLATEIFSLSNCEKSIATDFITYLVDFIIAHDIPVKQPLQGLTDDVIKYVYSCCFYKKCAVCGDKAELHHVDRIGMGNDRKKVNHLGLRVLPLCRKHHIEAHDSLLNEFLERHHLDPVKLNEELCKKWRLNYEISR